MNKALWAVQIVLALAFLGAGGNKIAQSKEVLQPQMAWVEDFSETQLKVIGSLEVAGAIGLIAPAATGIMPILTPVAAAGLGLTMLGAAATHIGRGEYPFVIANVALLSLSLFVAWGRWKKVPLGKPKA